MSLLKNKFLRSCAVMIAAVSASFVIVYSFSGIAQADVAPAGGRISVQATATYEISSTRYNAASNILTATVKHVYGIEVSLANASKTQEAGEEVSFAFSIKNTGNGTDEINLSTLQSTTDGFNLESLSIHVDTDNDGAADDPAVTIDKVNLNSGSSISIVVKGTVPSSGVKLGDKANFDLTATSAGDVSVTDKKTATVTVGKSPTSTDHITITAKQLLDADCDGKGNGDTFADGQLSDVEPGQCIRYQFVVENISKPAISIANLVISAPVPEYSEAVSCTESLCSTLHSNSKRIADTNLGTGKIGYSISLLEFGDIATIEYTVKVDEK